MGGRTLSEGGGMERFRVPREGGGDGKMNEMEGLGVDEGIEVEGRRMEDTPGVCERSSLPAEVRGRAGLVGDPGGDLVFARRSTGAEMSSEESCRYRVLFDVELLLLLARLVARRLLVDGRVVTIAARAAALSSKPTEVKVTGIDGRVISRDLVVLIDILDRQRCVAKKPTFANKSNSTLTKPVLTDSPVSHFPPFLGTTMVAVQVDQSP